MKPIILNLFFLGLIIGILYFFFFNNKKSDINTKKEISVGMMSGWEPFMNFNKQGEMYGFDVDLCIELEKVLDVKINILDLGSLPSCFIALEENKINCIMSGLDITGKRLETYEMICYDKKNEIRKAALINLKNTIIDLDNPDLKYNIGIEPGSSLEKLLNEYKSAEAISIPTIQEMILNLQFKKIDGFLVEYNLGQKIIKERSDLRLMDIKLPKDFIIYGIGMLLKKRDDSLISDLQKAINFLEENGTLNLLKNKHGI